MNSLNTSFRYLVSVIFLLLGVSNWVLAQGQSVADKTLTWHSEQSVEKHSGLTLNSPVTIKTKAKKTIDLTFPDQVMTFTIQSVNGTWQSENTDGMLTYSVVLNNTATGKIIIERISGKPKITIDLTETNVNGLHQEFLISTVESN